MTLLTVSDLRAFPVFASAHLTDAWLQTLLDANEQAIEAELGGPVGAVTENVLANGLSWLTLRRRAESVTSVTEDATGTTPLLLAADDYSIGWDRRSILRVGTGTNVAYGWPGGRSFTAVVYAAEDDEANRKRVQKALCELDVNAVPGATSEQIGAWMEQHQQSSVWNVAEERRAILDTLYPAGALDFA